MFIFHRGDQNWQGGPLLAAKISPGGPVLAGGTEIFVTVLFSTHLSHNSKSLLLFIRITIIPLEN